MLSGLMRRKCGEENDETCQDDPSLADMRLMTMISDQDTCHVPRVSYHLRMYLHAVETNDKPNIYQTYKTFVH